MYIYIYIHIHILTYTHVHIYIYLGSILLNLFILCYPPASSLYPARKSFKERKGVCNSDTDHRYPCNIFPYAFSQVLAKRFQVLLCTWWQKLFPLIKIKLKKNHPLFQWFIFQSIQLTCNSYIRDEEWKKTKLQIGSQYTNVRKNLFAIWTKIKYSSIILVL